MHFFYSLFALSIREALTPRSTQAPGRTFIPRRAKQSGQIPAERTRTQKDCCFSEDHGENDHHLKPSWKEVSEPSKTLATQSGLASHGELVRNTDSQAVPRPPESEPAF